MAGTVIVGASLSGLKTAEALRQKGYTGSVTIIGAEEHLPYDRPPLSKQFLIGSMAPSDVFFRQRKHFIDLGIDIRLSTHALKIDASMNVLHTTGGCVEFENLVVATGARARNLPGAGALSGVHTMRTLDDAKAILAALAKRPRVAVVGAGFIGAEVASSARARGLDVTVVEALPHPLERAVGIEVGEICASLHSAGGTELKCGVGVDALVGDRSVKGIRLVDGTIVEADLVVVGIGVSPNIEWLSGSGLDLSNGVVCDRFMCVGPANIFAVGDVAAWWNPLFTETMRVEHWTNAVEQALVVGSNIVNTNSPSEYAGVPYFWSDQYGHRIQFAGRSQADEVLLVPGTRETGRLIALYRRDDRLIGALTIDRPKILMQLRLKLMQSISWHEANIFVAQTLSSN